MKLGKRILAGVICFFMIALQILTLAACGGEKECSHHYGKWFKTKIATCTEEGIDARRCEHCGDIETSTIMPNGHVWNDATCTTPKTCKICGEKDGSAKGHTFTVDTVKPEALKSAATCSEAAVYFKSCSCGAISSNPEEIFTSGSALGHTDANKDHACDNGCTQAVGEHTDGDDKDHLCDYGCGRIADDGCYDTVKDGKCDECEAVIGHVCVDSDKNHACDTCGADMGVCADENKNHKCDYGCAKTFGEHTDGDDADHKCDYGCKQIADLGCVDLGNDGICDECGAEIEHECVDEDKNHLCEICSANMGDHIDRNFDHVCEYGCEEEIGVCEDTDKDHKCDYGCTETFGEHSDANDDADHVCDYGCGAVLESCYDDEADGDHNCDLCGNADVSGHSWGEATCGSPATCSDCGATTGSTLEHTDANFDHICDNGCGKNDMGNHSDAKDDADHLCDYGCKAVLEECSDVDTDADHNCDICGKADVTQHSYATETVKATCDDPAKNIYTCNCGHSYEETVGIALGHDLKGVERQIDGCEYVMEYICQRAECGKVVESETTYHHKYAASIDKPATCIEEGRKVFKCSECGDTNKAPEAIPADSTGHDWHQIGDIVGGVRTDECSVCHTTKSVTVYEDVAEDLTAKDFENEIEVNNANISLDQGVIDKIGEDSVTLSADKLEGDARKDLGLTDEQLEKQVGNSPIYNFTINNGTENISDFGENNYVTITLPYELAEGEDVDSIAIWFISDKCANEECETENCEDPAHRLVSMLATYNNGFVTFKTNHFSYYTVTRLTPAERCELYDHLYSKYEVKGSCTADSYTLEVCIRCHHERVTNLVVADGHDYVVTDSNSVSCTENGSTTYTCSDCGDTYTVTTFAIGHIWELEHSEKATCAADGYTKYGCKNCDEEYTVTYAKLPHEYTNTKVEATCTADGYTVHDCNNCDYSFTDKFVEALGHGYEKSEWVWAADYSSATLTFVCKNDPKHVISVNADITTSVLNGSCSVFVKTTYTATVSFNGIDYTDEKSVERGDPNHNFSDVWKKDKNEHWHECICGERTDVTAHAFENATTVKEPTCAEAGQSVATCTVCGELHKSTIPATGKHNYVNGFCTECGAEHLQNYYVNLVNSYKNIDGFSISIKDLSIDIKEENKNLVEKFELVGSIKQIDVVSLALSFADGKLEGAAIGNLTIFNGPIANQDAIYKFKAIIDNGFVYIQLEQGTEANLETTNIKVSAESLINSMLDNMDVGSEAIELLNFFKDTVIPEIDTLIDLNANTVDEFLKDAFNIIFTFEQNTDGSYVARLDNGKLKALNENLATKPVAEVVDLYFGEGKFDSITNWIKELFERKLSDLPEYVDELGLNSEELIEKINEFCLNIGAPDDFDFNDVINGEEYKDITLGMLMFGSEDDSYIDNINKLIDSLRESTLYELISEGDPENIKDGIDGILDAMSDGAAISFITDSTGMLTSIGVGADDFTYTQGDIEIHATFKLELLINGTIDVTWNDIIDEIESGIVLPKDEMLDSRYDADYYTTSGTLTYKGNDYKFNGGYRVNAYKPDYSNLNYIMYTKNCSGWMSYEAAYSEIYASFIIAPITVDGKNIMVIFNQYTDEAVELITTENGFTAVFEDGTTKDIAANTQTNDMAELFADIYFAVFGDASGSNRYMGKYVRYYYNATLNEYSSTDMHDYKYEYDVNGESCEDGCTVHTTCTKCDYSSTTTRKHCQDEYGVVIDLSKYSSCGGTARVNRCKVCGRINFVQDMNVNCNMGGAYEEDILDESGAVIGKKQTCACADCDLIFITESYKEYYNSCEYIEYRTQRIYKGSECVFEFVQENHGEEHKYEETYEFNGDGCEDGYKLISTCTVCGQSYTSHHGGHRYETRETDLEEYGLCGGNIYESYCPTCGKLHHSNINEYCAWEYVSTDASGYSTYVCKKCGATKMTYSHTSEKDAECNYIVTDVRIYVMGGKEVYRYESSREHSAHRYTYSFDVNGDSCINGYTAIATCQDCGHSYEERHSGYHSTYEFFRSDSISGCCDSHYINVYGCPCGEEFSIRFENYSMRFDKELGIYVCDDCGLKVIDNSVRNENGCLTIETRTFAVYLGDELLYTVSSEKTYQTHNFTKVEIVENDGKKMIVTTCDKCSEVSSTEFMEAEFEGYYDYTFTPNVSGEYNIVVYSENYVRFTLYQSVAGQLMQRGSSGGHQIHYSMYLEAGMTYVFRFSTDDLKYDGEYDKPDISYPEIVYPDKGDDFVIVDKNGNASEYVTGGFAVVDKVEGSVSSEDVGYGNDIGYGNDEGFVTDKEEGYDKEEDKEMGGTVESKGGKVIFIITADSENSCYHGKNNGFAILPDGADSCEDGAYYGNICVNCGKVENIRKEYDHNSIEKDRVELSEKGACYGEFVYRTCACGENHNIEFYGCAGEYKPTVNEYYEDGKFIIVEVYTCKQCGLRYSRSYYAVDDSANCKQTYYYTVTINIGEELIFHSDYTVVQSVHDYETVVTLMNGIGSSCTDGVIITEKCKNCGHEETRETYSHKTYEKQQIDLSELGCECGGYAVVIGCACGERNQLSLDHCLCDFGREWCEIWIDGVINDSQYTINGYNYYDYASYIYTCAVTDPTACAYKIRYAKYWLKADDECMAYQYETWQFGYNEETGEYLYEITLKIGSGRAYHNYTDESTKDCSRYSCEDCGSYYYENNYYDENNNRIKYEKQISNTLNDGKDKYFEIIEEYSIDEKGKSYLSRRYERRIYSNGEEYWSEDIRTEEDYEGTFGENGKKVTVSSSSSKGGSSLEEYAYVYYKGYEFRIYSYKANGEDWERYEYAYSFTDGCVCTETYTNSDKGSRTNTYDACKFYNSETLKAPTCSQNGEACDICVICGKQGEIYTLHAHDHDWVDVSDNWYYCFNCGLENKNGVSGDIIMEDLTEAYGNGENYVVGYNVNSGVDFTKYISLILADGTEVPIMSGVEFFEIDGICAFAFSKAEVDAWAAENGYTDYEVRFSFVPKGADGSFDYAITFTESTVPDTIVGNVSFVEYVEAGETVTYTVTPAENGNWTFTSFANADTYAELYSVAGERIIASDDDSGKNSNFRIDAHLKAGQSYVIQIRWLDSSYAGEMPILIGSVA